MGDNDIEIEGGESSDNEGSLDNDSEEKKNAEETQHEVCLF
jgi:hypothetical protein